MIDIHTHILPNIDDGARSIDETFKLIKEAQNAGFEAIVSTSHYREGYYETDTPEREVWLKAIYDNLKAKNIDIQLFLGNEIFISDKMISWLEQEKASTINDTSYVLFELPLNEEPDNLYDVIYEMTQNKLVPVLAHPERYSFVQKEPELLYDLIKRGVLIQSNYGSILGQYGDKAEFIVRKMFKANMVHFLGSDVHKPNTIYPKMEHALAIISNIIGQEKLEKLTTTNPCLLLQNKRIEIEEPHTIELTWKEKFMMSKDDILKNIKDKIAKLSSFHRKAERE